MNAPFGRIRYQISTLILWKLGRVCHCCLRLILCGDKVVRAHFKSQEIKKARPESKFSAKTELIRQCYRRGYGKEQIRTLLKFIDWIIRLPDELEDRISEEIISIEEEYKMPYVPTWERRAEMKGREEGIALGKEKWFGLGRKEGAQDRNIEIARKMLKKGISLDIISETTGLSRSEVEALQAEEPVH